MTLWDDLREAAVTGTAIAVTGALLCVAHNSTAAEAAGSLQAAGDDHPVYIGDDPEADVIVAGAEQEEGDAPRVLSELRKSERMPFVPGSGRVSLSSVIEYDIPAGWSHVAGGPRWGGEDPTVAYSSGPGILSSITHYGLSGSEFAGSADLKAHIHGAFPGESIKEEEVTVAGSRSKSLVVRYEDKDASGIEAYTYEESVSLAAKDGFLAFTVTMRYERPPGLKGDERERWHEDVYSRVNANREEWLAFLNTCRLR